MIDVQLNEAMRIVSGTVRSTAVAWLPVLCNIIPPELRRKKALSNLIFKSEHLENPSYLTLSKKKLTKD